MPKKTEIWLIRHGETDYNAEGRTQGHADIELNSLGRQQAQQLGKYLCEQFKHRNSHSPYFSGVYSSDLKRASETAEIVSKQLAAANIISTSDIKLDSRIRELDFGIFTGVRWVDHSKVLKEYLAKQEAEAAKVATATAEDDTVLVEEAVEHGSASSPSAATTSPFSSSSPTSASHSSSPSSSASPTNTSEGQRSPTSSSPKVTSSSSAERPGYVNFCADPEKRVGGEKSESYAELQYRVNDFLHNTVLRENEGKRALVFCHGGSIKCYICGVLNIPLKNSLSRIRCDNTSITRVIITTNSANNIVKRELASMNTTACLFHP